MEADTEAATKIVKHLLRETSYKLKTLQGGGGGRGVKLEPPRLRRTSSGRLGVERLKPEARHRIHVRVQAIPSSILFFSQTPGCIRSRASASTSTMEAATEAVTEIDKHLQTLLFPKQSSGISRIIFIA